MNRSSLSFQTRLIVTLLIVSQLFALAAIAADEDSVGETENNTILGPEKLGPENLLKTLPTPFTTTVSSEGSSYYSDNAASLNPIGIDSTPSKNPLLQHFRGPKLYLPSRLVIGECSEFVIKGDPGAYAAIAMSEGNKGAKPILGHKLRLGPDRKLVTLGTIPETGVLSLYIETPIQGDLVDSSLYFEGVVWHKPDFSDMELASTVLTSQEAKENGVLVTELQGKKEHAVVFDGIKPMSTRTIGGQGSLSSGRP